MKLPGNLNLDKRSLAFIILTVVLIVEVGLFLPLQVSKIRELNKEIATAKNNLANLDRDWPKRSQYLEENENLREEIKMINGKFFSPRQEASMLSFLSSESEGFAIKIEVLKPIDVKERASTKFGVFESLPVMVKATGRFHNLVRFLDYLQNSKYFFEVKKLDIFSGEPYHSIDMIICGLIKE